MTIDEAIKILDPETSREALEPYRLDCALRLAVVEEACRLAVRELAEVETLRSQNEQLREANALTVKATTDRLCREWISVSERLPEEEEKQNGKMISVDKLIEYCKKCADMSQGLADKVLENIGKGESVQSALGACAFFSIRARMYRHEIPDVIRAFTDGGADNGE